MKWFKHDTNVIINAKIKKLILRHGAEGYAVYFHCLELIAGELTNDKITFELEHDAEVIADNLKIKGTDSLTPIDKVNNIMRYIIELKLFKESENKIFCFKLAKRLDSSLIKNPQLLKIKKNIKNREKSRKIEIFQDNIRKNQLDKIRLDKTRIEKKKNIIDVSQKMRNDKYIELSKLLYEEHKKNDENYLSGKNLNKIFDRWSNDIRLLIEKDKRNYDIVKNVIKWCQTPGNFWVPNILSGKKLREKFDMLLMQYKQNGKNEQKKEKEESEWAKKYKHKLHEIAEFDPGDIEIDESIFDR